MITRDFSYAARFRDVINRMITVQVNKIRPRPAVGTVTAVNESNKTVLVQYPGDTASVPVSYGALVPGVGAVVFIDGLAERRYVADVISGPFTAGAGGGMSGLKFLGHWAFPDGTTKFATDAVSLGSPIFSIVPLTSTLSTAKNYYMDLTIPYWAGLVRMEVDSFVTMATVSGNNMPAGTYSTSVYLLKQNANGSFSQIVGERSIPGAIPLAPGVGTATPNINWRATWDIVFAPIAYTSPPPATTTTGNVGITGGVQRIYFGALRYTVSGEVVNTVLQSARITVTAMGTANGKSQLF